MFYNGCGETLEKVAQRSCGCPVIGSIQGQVVWGFEQPGLVKDVPAHGRGVGLDDLQRSFPTQIMLRFQESPAAERQ